MNSLPKTLRAAPLPKVRSLALHSLPLPLFLVACGMVACSGSTNSDPPTSTTTSEGPNAPSNCTCRVDVNGTGTTLSCGESACLEGSTFTCEQDGPVETSGCHAPSTSAPNSPAKTSVADAGTTGRTTTSTPQDAGAPPKSTSADAGSPATPVDAGPSRTTGSTTGGTFTLSDGVRVVCQSGTVLSLSSGGYLLNASSCDRPKIHSLSVLVDSLSRTDFVCSGGSSPEALATLTVTYADGREYVDAGRCTLSVTRQVAGSGTSVNVSIRSATFTSREIQGLTGSFTATTSP
ncbi:MAG: hypothetical protein U0169_14170 [Polyangiaceae bacterium]